MLIPEKTRKKAVRYERTIWLGKELKRRIEKAEIVIRNEKINTNTNLVIRTLIESWLDEFEIEFKKHYKEGGK